MSEVVSALTHSKCQESSCCLSQIHKTVIHWRSSSFSVLLQTCLYPRFHLNYRQKADVCYLLLVCSHNPAAFLQVQLQLHAALLEGTAGLHLWGSSHWAQHLSCVCCWLCMKGVTCCTTPEWYLTKLLSGQVVGQC